ncbi:hypothetical protein SUGI_0776310 [Cryptomeria japonica]|nr:hypothetical protein SUGI_0776310 [Cryptomeria japonica]
MNVSVTVFLVAFVSSASQLINDAFAGSLNISTRTHMAGRVTILHLIKRHVNVVALCDITVDVISMNVKFQKCKNSYKLRPILCSWRRDFFSLFNKFLLFLLVFTEVSDFTVVSLMPGFLLGCVLVLTGILFISYARFSVGMWFTYNRNSVC